MNWPKIVTLGTLLALAGCGGQSYDDCMLQEISAATSDLAVRTARESCQRKYEVEQSGKLDAMVVVETKLVVEDPINPENNVSREFPRLQVSNPTSSIVTQFVITDSNRQEWTYDAWIDPGRLETVDLPADENFNSGETGTGEKIDARYSRVIPTS